MLEVRNLSVEYTGVKAVEGVSLAVAKGESLGVVGESGSGKSTIALAIMRLISAPGKIVGGEVNFQGRDLLKISEEEMIKVRGAKISMIFQDPFTSLNPVFTIGDQIAEAVALHQGLNRRDSWKKAVEMLELVRIRDPGLRSRDYPHQFSGGMRQRAMIAMALACQPDLLLADEPTTALDVTIQAEILSLLKDIQKQLGFGLLFITHNFGIVKEMCGRAAVIYKGKLVEEGAVDQIINSPQQEYTRRLIGCVRALKG